MSMTETKLIQALWPLPGGNGRYLVTLDQIVNWVATAQTPSRETFETWLMSHFNVGTGTINGYLQVVTAMGMLVQQADGALNLPTLGKQFLQSEEAGKAMLVAEQFMRNYLAFPEVLAVYAEANKPIHIKTVVATLQPHFPRWTTSAQYEYRALWLLSLGCLRQEKGRFYEITDFGHEIAQRYPSQAPTLILH
jgi:hypothetical protein